MRSLLLALAGVSACSSFAITANAADIHKKIIAELDPIAPSSAAYDEQFEAGVDTSSKWGAKVDFNIAGILSTGPEFWTGNFVVRGDGNAETLRREDMFPGERHKLDGTRLRWNFTRWGEQSSMRDWYVTAAYSYLRINSRANRFDEQIAGGEGDAIAANFFTGTPDDETDLVTDIRHGVALAFGNRWLIWNQNLSLTVGASITGTFKRTVGVESRDPNARTDYDRIIEDLADTRMTVRPIPEGNIGLGYAW